MRTDEMLDFALEGNALFEISDVQRDENGEVVTDDEGNPLLTRQWTRDGSFRLTPQPGDDANFYLTTQHGHIVRGIDDEPIRIPRGDRISIDSNGNITSYNDLDPTAFPIPMPVEDRAGHPASNARIRRRESLPGQRYGGRYRRCA